MGSTIAQMAVWAFGAFIVGFGMGAAAMQGLKPRREGIDLKVDQDEIEEMLAG